MIPCKVYDGFIIRNDLSIYSFRTRNKLTPFIGSDGYQHVSYRNADGTLHHNRVHVLLAHAYIPNPNNFRYVNHIDSNKLNNTLENLEWCTNSYNVYHGWHSGNRTHANRTRVVVTDAQTNTIVGIYPSIRECGSSINMDRHKIARILKGELPANYFPKYLFSYE